VFPEDGRDAETLIRNADAAMYHAKGMGRANYQFFTEQMNVAASHRLALESDLRRAIGRHELRLFLQPIVEARSARISGHEALLRWQHPRRGVVAPGDFLPVAEETGLIVAIGEWALREACAWALASKRALPVAVNLSARQFSDPKLADTVAAALAHTGLPARLLELEVTESAAMHKTELTLGTFAKLKALGVSIVIDDFGTGHSSLYCLRRFPVDKLKIDGAFVSEVPTDAKQSAVVSAIVAMAHALGVQVTAEGVETEAQRRYLEQCGCDHVQGFLTGAPLEAEAAARRLL
jgi:diguanylate cyclase